MSRLARVLGAVVIVLSLAPSAHAQLVGLKHVWTVPGTMQTSSIGTAIACTNGATAGQTIGVEMYGPSGLVVGTPQAIAVAPAATVIFASSNFAPGSISVDASLSTGLVSKGYARVMATTNKGVLCSAFLGDIVNASPTNLANLTVAKAFKQKGD